MRVAWNEEKLFLLYHFQIGERVIIPISILSDGDRVRHLGRLGRLGDIWGRFRVGDKDRGKGGGFGFGSGRFKG